MRLYSPLLLTVSLLPSLGGLAQATDARKDIMDVQHYRFDIQLNDDNDTIKGDAYITIKFLQDCESFDLDLVNRKANGKGMTVIRAMESDLLVNFSQNGDILHIVNKVKAGWTRRYSILYSGIPADGLIIDRNKYGHRTFFADNWPNRAHNWLPCVDHPSDKASVEFFVTAPEHYQVVSNGVQQECSSLPDHQRLTWWQETVPLPTKIMVIGVADFAIKHACDIDSIPVSSWVYPETKYKGFYDYGLACNILPFYIKNIGPYPYRKLANVQSKTMFGGMENAGAIFYSENSVTGDGKAEALLAHEIAHQWFGDNATEANWQHIWLSEGFATYMTHLYIQKAYNSDSMLHGLREDRREVIAFSAKNHAPVVDTSVTDNFMQLLNANSYQKGGWVLHMLRRRLGDTIFWKGIRAYYARYGGHNATTDDFRKAMESVCKQDLAPFFRQWLYTPGQPAISGKWNYDPVKKSLTIQLEQTQSVLFEFPLQIGIRSSGKPVVKSFNIKNRLTTLRIPLATKPESVGLDPNVNLLFKGEITEASIP